MLNLRRIPLESAFNVRDLGGYPADNGRCTKWGLLFRADTPSSLSPADWSVLEQRGIKMLIDLRSNSEAKARPVDAPSSMSSLHFSLMRQVDEMPDFEALQESNDASLGYSLESFIKSTCFEYGAAVQSNIGTCVQVMNTILAGIGSGGVLFFCSAGKDRTGIIAALVLYICGVSHEDIVADYMVSAVYNRRGINKAVNASERAFAAIFKDQELRGMSLRSDAETMDRFLDDIDEMDVCALLDANGFSYEQQAQLKEAFSEQV